MTTCRSAPGGLVGVADVDVAARYCETSGCELTVRPRDVPWGERYLECVDPSGYAWKLYRSWSDRPGVGPAEVAPGGWGAVRRG